MVTVIVILGILPYISIQLKAIAASFSLLRQYPEVTRLAASTQHPAWMDTTLYVALVLIVFSILFGTRHIDNTERHEGNGGGGGVRILAQTVCLRAESAWW